MTSIWSRLSCGLLSFLLYACSTPAPPVSAGPLASEVVQVFFSPNGGATEAVVHELANAKTEILVQAYSFTSAPIAKALVDAHNEIMIIDQAAVITGSFNFTKAAEEKNAENLLVIKGDTELVKKYLANFKEHLGHSERYEGR